MLASCIFMFVLSVLCLVLGVKIRKGNTKLIHDYHQTHIKESDLLEYGKEFSNGMFTLTGALLLSGILYLIGSPIGAIGILFAGILVSVLIFVKVQKKYNGGIF